MDLADNVFFINYVQNFIRVASPVSTHSASKIRRLASEHI